MAVLAAGAVVLAFTFAAAPVSRARAAVDSDFVTRQGTSLYLNGQPYRFTGINIYTANLRDNCVKSYSGGYYGSVLDNDLAQFDAGTGGHSRVFRAWFFQSLATTNGARDWTAFDHTLAQAQSRGFKVIAVLGDEWGDCEAAGATGPNGLGYRDISFYQGGYKRAPDVGHVGGSSEGGTTSYRQWVQDVVSRYANNPAIFAWQLMDEAQAGTYYPNGSHYLSCPNQTTAFNALLSWATDMTALVKSIDPNHLISVGTLDNSCGTEGSDDIAISAVSGNDLCDYHDYSSPSTTIPAALSYMIEQCKRIGRPTIVDELGVNATDPTINGDLRTRATDLAAKMTADFQAGVAGILPWVWDGTSSRVDRFYQMGPGDPALTVLGAFGASPPAEIGPGSGTTPSPGPSGSGPTQGSASGPAPSGAPNASGANSSGQNTSPTPAQLVTSGVSGENTWTNAALVSSVLRIVRAVGVMLSRM